MTTDKSIKKSIKKCRPPQWYQYISSLGCASQWNYNTYLDFKILSSHHWGALIIILKVPIWMESWWIEQIFWGSDSKVAVSLTYMYVWFSIMTILIFSSSLSKITLLIHYTYPLEGIRYWGSGSLGWIGDVRHPIPPLASRSPLGKV